MKSAIRLHSLLHSARALFVMMDLMKTDPQCEWFVTLTQEWLRFKWKSWSNSQYFVIFVIFVAAVVAYP